MTTITSTGIGSGIDIESIVTAIVEAERAPVKNQLDLREAETTVTLSALGNLRSALSEIQSAVAPLASSGTYSRFNATPSDESVFTAQVTTASAASNHTIEVRQLAQAQRLVTQTDFASSRATVGTGTLTFSSGAGGFSIDIDDTNNSLTAIRDAINNSSDNNVVTASIVNGDSGSKLIFQAKTAGTENGLTVSATDDDGDGGDAVGLSRLASTQLDETAAADAIVVIDGQTVTTSGNTLTDAIEGVTIDLLKADVGVEYTLDIQRDTSAINESISGFVDAYNNALSTINGLSSYDNESGEAGPLQGDATLRSVMSQMRNLFGEQVFGATAGYQTFSAIGISVQRDGALSLDSFQLSQAITDGADFGALLAGDSGIAARFDETLQRFTGFTGLIQNRQDSLNGQLSKIDEDREGLEMRMSRLEERTYAQFNAMDMIIANMTSTQSYLDQALDNLPGYTSK